MHMDRPRDVRTAPLTAVPLTMEAARRFIRPIRIRIIRITTDQDLAFTTVRPSSTGVDFTDADSVIFTGKARRNIIKGQRGTLCAS